MARYDETIDLLLEYIDKPTASYILSFVSSFISTTIDSFPSAKRMVTLSEEICIQCSHMPFDAFDKTI